MFALVIRVALNIISLKKAKGAMALIFSRTVWLSGPMVFDFTGTGAVKTLPKSLLISGERVNS